MTVAERPAAATTIAADRPFGPEPMTVAVVVGDGIDLFRCTIVQAEAKQSATKREAGLYRIQTLKRRLAMQTIKSISTTIYSIRHTVRASHFLARWLFLRALGLIYFSAFFALLFK